MATGAAGPKRRRAAMGELKQDAVETRAPFVVVEPVDTPDASKSMSERAAVELECEECNELSPPWPMEKELRAEPEEALEVVAVVVEIL